MLREIGTVSAVAGDFATVQTQNQLACASCKVVDTCGNGIVEKYLSGKIFSSKLSNRLNAQVGDEVIIEIPKSSITKASMMVYFVPLLGLISFAVVASLLQLSENLIIFTSLTGFGLSLLVTKYYNHKILDSELYLPKMVSIIDTKASDINKASLMKLKPINVKVV